MPRNDGQWRLLPAIACAALLATLPAVARADPPPTGGASLPTRPVIAGLSCGQGQTSCARGDTLTLQGEDLGDTLTLQGEDLGDTRLVTFLGRRGPQDDRRTRPKLLQDHLLTVRVPSRARTTHNAHPPTISTADVLGLPESWPPGDAFGPDDHHS